MGWDFGTQNTLQSLQSLQAVRRRPASTRGAPVAPWSRIKTASLHCDPALECGSRGSHRAERASIGGDDADVAARVGAAGCAGDGAPGQVDGRRGWLGIFDSDRVPYAHECLQRSSPPPLIHLAMLCIGYNDQRVISAQCVAVCAISGSIARATGHDSNVGIKVPWGTILVVHLFAGPWMRRHGKETRWNVRVINGSVSSSSAFAI